MIRGIVRKLVSGGLVLAVGFLLALQAPAAATPAVAAQVVQFLQVAGSGWICNRADNICGLDDARMLSNPAKVDYDRLMRATPEMKKVRAEGIDPDSVKGIQLRQAAVDRVRRACDAEQQARGHCSVWKAISHRDGRVIPDITDAVLLRL
jgi:hypothetical protein